MVKISTGHYRTYFKSTTGLSEDIIHWTVKYSEFSLTADEYKAASRVMPEGGAGAVTLDNSNANKDIIAKALKERDVSGVSAVSGSIYDDIVAPLSAIFAKLPSGTISDLALSTLIDTGLTLGQSLELAAAMADGRLKKRIVGSDTFLDIYKRNSTTVLSTVKVTETERTREALP